MMNPFKNKKGLGRGLSSLIGDVKTTNVNNKLSLSDIIRNRYQPRKNFDKVHLEELSNSIKERGVVQPIIVRKSEDLRDKYEIIASISNVANKEEKGVFIEACKQLNIKTITEKTESERILKIKEYGFEVVVVGNVGQLNKIADNTDMITVMIYHGIGLKQSYYNCLLYTSPSPRDS